MDSSLSQLTRPEREGGVLWKHCPTSIGFWLF